MAALWFPSCRHGNECVPVKSCVCLCRAKEECEPGLHTSTSCAVNACLSQTSSGSPLRARTVFLFLLSLFLSPKHMSVSHYMLYRDRLSVWMPRQEGGRGEPLLKSTPRAGLECSSEAELSCGIPRTLVLAAPLWDGVWGRSQNSNCSSSPICFYPTYGKSTTDSWLQLNEC